MDSVVLEIKNICPGTLSNSDGLILFCAIESALRDNQKVVLSFSGISAISTSFLNSSIGELVEKNGLSHIRNRIHIKNYIPALGAVVKKYIANLKQAELL